MSARPLVVISNVDDAVISPALRRAAIAQSLLSQIDRFLLLNL